MGANAHTTGSPWLLRGEGTQKGTTRGSEGTTEAISFPIQLQTSQRIDQSGRKIDHLGAQPHLGDCAEHHTIVVISTSLPAGLIDSNKICLVTEFRTQRCSNLLPLCFQNKESKKSRTTSRDIELTSILEHLGNKIGTVHILLYSVSQRMLSG